MTDPSKENGQWICAAVLQYEGKLLRYAHHLLGDSQRARDVVQDTFLKLCKQQQSEIEPRIAAWLFTVCRNRSLDVMRKEKRMTQLSPAATDQQQSRHANPAESAAARDTADSVLRLVASLPPNQQECMRLRFQGGLTYRQISEVTDLSESNVGYLLHKAIAELRRQLKTAK